MYYQQTMNYLVKFLSLGYSVAIAYEFFLWDACFYYTRSESSPKINFLLVALGVIPQIAHIAGVLYIGVLRKTSVNPSLDNVMKGLIFLFFTLMSTPAVEHGMLRGDQLKAYFLNSGCWEFRLTCRRCFVDTSDSSID